MLGSLNYRVWNYSARSKDGADRQTATATNIVSIEIVYGLKTKTAKIFAVTCGNDSACTASASTASASTASASTDIPIILRRPIINRIHSYHHDKASMFLARDTWFPYTLWSLASAMEEYVMCTAAAKNLKTLCWKNDIGTVYVRAKGAKRMCSIRFLVAYRVSK